MICKNCGAEIGDVPFCTVCGAPQGEQAAGTEPDNTSSEPVISAPAEPQPAPEASPAPTAVPPVEPQPAPAPQGQQAASPQPSQQAAYQPPYQQTVPIQKGPDPVAARFQKLFRDPWYLILTLLVTAWAVLTGVAAYTNAGQIASQVTDQVEVTPLSSAIGAALIPCLFVLALWILCIAGRSKKSRFPSGGLTLASGTLFFIEIVGWIVIVLLTVGAVLVLALGATTIEALQSQDYFDANAVIFEPIKKALGQLDLTANTSLWVIAGILFGIAVVLALVMILFYGNLHRFAKSLSVSANTGRYHVKAINAAKNWLIVAAVLVAAGAVYSFTQDATDVLTLAASCCNALAMLLASILIRKHLVYLGQS